jgi:hypothetical protein
MSTAAEALAEMPEEGQLDFFDASVYKEHLFSLSGANKHATERELRPAQRVSGRFTGAVVGLALENFADESKVPTRVFKISADYVELD